MATLAGILGLIAIIGWIVGMVKPSLVLRWGKIKNRKRLTVYCVILLFIAGLIAPSDTESIAQNSSDQVKSEQQQDSNESSNQQDQSQGDKEQVSGTTVVAAPIATSTGNADNTSKETKQESQSKPDNVPSSAIPAKVINVVDGDTIKVLVQGKEETVRMILVDTPETKHPSKPVEPFGPEASQFTTEMLDGKDVYLELDVQERDQYGRLLAYVWVGGKLFNKMLLEKGLARVAVYPPNVKYVDEFRAVQKQAQEKGIGIWSVENYAQEEKKQNNSNQTAKKTETKKESSSSKNTKQQAAPKSNSRCADPKIKGNINSKGEKIYHVPGGAYYDRTIPEAWFCTEEEAKAAGFRPSKR